MNKITSSNQYFFNFKRDLNASLDNFYFSKKNEILKNELGLFIILMHIIYLFLETKG